MNLSNNCVIGHNVEKSTQKVSFYKIASEASNVFLQKSIKFSIYWGAYSEWDIFWQFKTQWYIEWSRTNGLWHPDPHPDSIIVDAKLYIWGGIRVYRMNAKSLIKMDEASHSDGFYES